METGVSIIMMLKRILGVILFYIHLQAIQLPMQYYTKMGQNLFTFTYDIIGNGIKKLSRDLHITVRVYFHLIGYDSYFGLIVKS